MTEKVLELGCGSSKREGAVGVDILAGSAADVIHDLDVFPYPFRDDEWDRILCFDVLEHVRDFVACVEEIWRIARPGATVEATGPFMSSVNYFSDPTHRRAFGRARFQLKTCDYDRDQLPLRGSLHRYLLGLANRHKTRYEERFAFVFPVHKVFFELEVVK
jgi:SAM-dependent methyltransferase